MQLRAFLVGARRRLHSSRALQIGLVVGVWLAGDAVVRHAGLPIPGGIVGMIILLALLASGRLSEASVRRGANWFITEMLLFFIPAVLAILDHRELLGLLGLKILALIAMSTALVMGVTALVVDLGFRAAAPAGGKRHGVV